MFRVPESLLVAGFRLSHGDFWDVSMIAFRRRSQPVDATHAVNIALLRLRYVNVTIAAA